MKWNSKTRRYVDGTGKEIPPRQVHQWIEEFIDSQKTEINGEGQKVLTGSLASAAFFSWMRERVKSMNGASAVVAYGGEQEMTEERWARVGEKIASEYEYLTGFQADVAAADAIEQAIWIPDRATMYADSVYSTYENSVKAREGDAGLLSARRVCEDDDASCEDCPALATDEYLPLDEVADIGDSTCASRCRCWLEFDYAGVEPIEIDREVYA